MSIEEIKKEMAAYTDFFGQDLLDYDMIKDCKNKGELRAIIDRHSEHLEMQVSDGLRHLDRLTEKLFLIK